MASAKSNFYHILNGSDNLHEPKLGFDDGLEASDAAQGNHILTSDELTKHLYAYTIVPTNAGKNIQMIQRCTLDKQSKWRPHRDYTD
jgi:hypothetical protein